MFHVETIKATYQAEPDGSAAVFHFRAYDWEIYKLFCRYFFRWPGRMDYKFSGSMFAVFGTGWTDFTIRLEVRQSRHIYTKWHLETRLRGYLDKAVNEAYLAALYDQCETRPKRLVQQAAPVNLPQLRDYQNSPRFYSELGRQ